MNVTDPSGHIWNWIVNKAKKIHRKINSWVSGEFKSKIDDGGNPDFFKIKPVNKTIYTYTPSINQYFPFTPESELRNGARVYKKIHSKEWKIRNVYSNKKYQTLVYKPKKVKKKKVNHANDRMIYLGMEMSRAEAERTKKFCDDAAYTAKEAVTAGTVAIGAAAIYSSGLGEVLTVAGAVIATTSTIAHGANVQEQVSGNNFLKDLVFDGDQKSYEKFQMGLALAEGAVAIAAISAQAKNNLKTKIKAKKKGEIGAGNVKVPQKAKDIAKKIKARNGTPPKGYKGGKVYQNLPKGGGQKLPEGIKYKEYDVNPYIKGKDRGTERIVIGNDGSVWYTNNHYKTFTKVE